MWVGEDRTVIKRKAELGLEPVKVLTGLITWGYAAMKIERRSASCHLGPAKWLSVHTNSKQTEARMDPLVRYEYQI